MIKTPDFFTFQPIFKERLWGGRELEKLGFKIPVGNIGECWGISAHPHGMSIVDQGPYKGKTLDEIYKKYPQWFNDEKKDRFPLLIKILDSKKDLSVQVHPNDEYALKYENDNGKHEAWYVLDALPNTKIQIGHTFQDKASLSLAINSGSIEYGLSYHNQISRGECFDIPPGTLHALCRGSLIFEVQQSSDVTYRVYDYNRLENGKKRDLHLKKALDVIAVPDKSHTINNSSINKYNQFNTLIENNKFKLNYLKKINYPFIIQKNNYLCGFLLNGSLIMNGKKILANQFFIIPSKIEPSFIEGEFEGLFIESIL
jgi:mannose-6-phosphate isomerase